MLMDTRCQITCFRDKILSKSTLYHNNLIIILIMIMITWLPELFVGHYLIKRIVLLIGLVLYAFYQWCTVLSAYKVALLYFVYLCIQHSVRVLTIVQPSGVQLLETLLGSVWGNELISFRGSEIVIFQSPFPFCYLRVIPYPYLNHYVSSKGILLSCCTNLG